MVGVYDTNGRALNAVTGQATCGTGCRGTFDTTIDYAVSMAQWGTLRVLDGDESGETEGIIRDIPSGRRPIPPKPNTPAAADRQGRFALRRVLRFGRGGSDAAEGSRPDVHRSRVERLAALFGRCCHEPRRVAEPTDLGRRRVP